jgi:pimeloyl-ACP methyl ester carboxylesterase
MKKLFWALVLLAAAIAAPPLWYAARPAPPPPELPAAGRMVQLASGPKVNVIENGAGAPVLLVHGHPGSAYDWIPTMGQLAGRGYRVLAYDRVGYGRSDGRPSAGPIPLETNAAELLELLAALDLRDVTLVGWSYGGGMSIVAARRDPARIARVVLVASVGPGMKTTAPMPPAVIPFVMGPLLSWAARVPPAMKALGDAVTRNAFSPSPVPDWFSVQGAANMGRPNTLATFRGEGFDLVGGVDLDPGAVQRPLLLLQGEQDAVLPAAIASELHRRAGHSELRLIPEAGHMLPITHPQLVAEAIAGFAVSGKK